MAANTANPPFDEHILRLRSDPRVTMFLLPLPILAGSNKSAASAASPAPAAAPKAGPKVQPKKKFKPTRKAERSKPEALANMETVTKDGQNVCWSFNLESGCQGPMIAGSKIPKCARDCMCAPFATSRIIRRRGSN